MPLKVNIPGLRNSDEAHWQSLFEKAYPDQFIRIHQNNWNEPNCTEWINKIEEDLDDKTHSELILIGHSIGCMAIVKWYEKYQHTIKGALLVSPSDSEREDYPQYITGFTPIPKEKLPFHSIVVTSNNDHVTSLKRTREFVNNWGSRLVVLDNAGHIETKSGFGLWPLGLELIKELER